jgi:molecular chaperone HscB
VSRPATDDPFELLGLPPSFRIDAARIRAAQVRRMTTVHPDRADGPAQAAEFARAAAAINDAARRLGDPIARGEALLARLRGERDSRSPADLSTAPNAAFLMEAMELREALDEAIEAQDAERIASLRADADDRFDVAMTDTADALEALGRLAASSAETEVRRACEALARLRYATRLRDRAHRPTSSSDPTADASPVGEG